MSKKWFFKRGNARLNWGTLPEWVQWVAVDRSGRVYGYSKKPAQIGTAWDCNHYCNPANFDLFASVGSSCPDWRDLLFGRPDMIVSVTLTGNPGELHFEGLSSRDCEVSINLGKPSLPTITAEEWAAVRLLLPGAEYIVKDRCGAVFASDGEIVFSRSTFLTQSGNLMRVVCLEDRFASIPWQDSLVKYEPSAVELPHIVIEHSDTKRKITGPFSVCGSHSYLRSIAEQILDETENSGYGWVRIDGGSKAIPNTPPDGWD